MIYLDTSAAAKVVLLERESVTLRSWLDAQADPGVSSVLTRLEMTRAAARRGGSVLREVQQMLDRLVMLPITDDIIDRACVVGSPQLRSLDSLHLATASALGVGLTAFVTYDRQLGQAALDAGLPAVAPGYEL